MTTKKLTKREAILLCKEMWQWLADHPEKSKMDYFLEKEIVQVPSCECYACEYNDVHKRNYCDSACILKWSGGGWCLSNSSEYNDWLMQKEKDNYRLAGLAAQLIVSLCDEALARLPKLKGETQ